MEKEEEQVEMMVDPMSFSFGSGKTMAAMYKKYLCNETRLRASLLGDGCVDIGDVDGAARHPYILTTSV